MSAAELKTCESDFPLCAAGAVPMAPVTTQLCVSRAISLTGSRNSGSLVKKGAGDSGQTIKSSCPLGIARVRHRRSAALRTEVFHSKLSQFTQRALESFAGPGFIHRNIFLHQQRRMICRNRRRVHQPPGLQHRSRSQRGHQQRASLFSWHQKRRRDRDIHQHDLERNSVNSCPGRDAAERNVIHLRGTQQVPRKAGDVEARQLHRDPQKRRGHQRAAIIAARSHRPAQQQTEQAVIKPEIKTKEKKCQQGQRHAQAAMLVHGVVNPVTRPRIPEHSGNIRQQKSLPGSRSLKIDRAIDLQHSRGPRTQERHNQRSKSHPGKNIDTGERKNQNLQKGREQNQQPGAEMNLPHRQG